MRFQEASGSMKARSGLCLTLMWSILAAVALLPASSSAQTVRNIEIPVKLSDSAVNDVIEQQWNEEGWDSFSGVILGCAYFISVPAPTVSFVEGSASLTLGFTASSGTCGGGPWSYTISPEIGIPSGQITTADVRMWLMDLLDEIDALPIPQWLKDALAEHFGPWADLTYLEGQIMLFPSQLLGDLTSEWFDQRSANLYYSNPFELGWQVDDGYITLKPSVNVQAGQGATVGPDFKARICWGANTDYLDLWSNIKAEVKEARVFNIAGGPLYTVEDPGVWTVKYHGDPSEWIWIDLEGTATSWTGVHPTWILFEIESTFYMRILHLVPAVCPSWTFATDGYNGI